MTEVIYSIIIPVYNAENHLCICIESILRQIIQKFEIILINDGSTDSSSTICEQYSRKDSRIKLIHQDNRGVCSARNKGIEEAKGEWISFVDADDTVTVDYLSEFDKIEQKADLNFFGSHFMSDDGYDATYYLPPKIYKGKTEIEQGVLILKQNTVNYGHYGYTWNKFFKSSIIKEHNIRFTPGIYFREDEIFVNDYISFINSLSTMTYVGYNYRYTKNGLSWKDKTIDYWRLYYKKSKEFLLKISNVELQRHEYSKVMIACYNVLEAESDNREYIFLLDEMLSLVKQFGHLYPYIGRKDYYASIMDYYKDADAKRRIDFLRMKKLLKVKFNL